MTIKSINPATEETIAEFQPLSDSDVDTAIEKSARAFTHHRQLSFDVRADRMKKAAGILRDRKEHWAKLLTTEMGKTLVSARAEIEKCALVCDYYAEHAERIMADEELEGDVDRVYVRHLPIGPVLAVMPWNFPFWQVFRFAAPALMAGNVGLLKHASNVPQCSLAIAEIFLQAGFDDGAFQSLLIGSDKVERIIKDDRVRGATLTGSEGAGRAVASQAGGEIKPSVMELGGSDAFIVMPSADMDLAVDKAITGRTMNNGQSCIAAKRFIVHADIHDAFRERFASRLEALTVGDPMDEATDIGPMATADIRAEVADQVEQTVKAGANCVVGAQSVDSTGYFFRPGMIEDVPESAPAYSEELFGPVAILFKVAGLDEALTLANATRFGLGSAIFTQETSEIERAVDGIDAGATFVNQIVASDPRHPFGGSKTSGYGRELYRDGLLAFVNRKTVSIA